METKNNKRKIIDSYKSFSKQSHVLRKDRLKCSLNKSLPYINDIKNLSKPKNLNEFNRKKMNKKPKDVNSLIKRNFVITQTQKRINYLKNLQKQNIRIYTRIQAQKTSYPWNPSDSRLSARSLKSSSSNKSSRVSGCSKKRRSPRYKRENNYNRGLRLQTMSVDNIKKQGMAQIQKIFGHKNKQQQCRKLQPTQNKSKNKNSYFPSRIITKENDGYRGLLHSIMEEFPTRNNKGTSMHQIKLR